MEREHISSGSPYEDRVGYARALKVGPRIWVSGTAPILPGDEDPPNDAYAQARLCFEIISSALVEAGATLADVVRSRLYLTSASDLEAVGRAHREALGEARPATTAIVTALVDPRWLVEIEVDALIEERA